MPGVITVAVGSLIGLLLYKGSFELLYVRG